ncbi:MAG: hypothetical protein NDJ18_08220 [candidate division Zixibacteria bacterium]|nr:hypothetical protein [candidate division Zixibacteria bacterium]
MMRLWPHAATVIGSYRKLWLGIYLGKLLLALAVSLPVLVLVQADLDHSAFARPLLGEWNVDVITELILTRENLFSFGMLGLLAISTLVFVLKQFLNGGIYDTLVNRPSLSGERFFSVSFRMFRPHLLIGVWMIVIYALLLLTAALVGELVTSVARKVLPSQDLARFIIRFSVTYAIILIGTVYSDIVRIQLTLSGVGRLSVPGSFRAGYHFFIRHGVQSIVTYARYFVPFVLAWLAIEGMALAITGSMGNMLGAMIEFVLFQLCSALRVWQSLSGTLAIAEHVKMHHQPAPVAAEFSSEESLDRPPLLS